MTNIEQTISSAIYPKNMTDYHRPPSDALISDNTSNLGANIYYLTFSFDLVFK